MTSPHPLDSTKTAVAPKRRRLHDATWPVPAEALAALADLGMSDEAIARYLRMDRATIRRARNEAAA